MITQHDTPTVTLQIDGQSVTVPAGTTIWEAARQAGIQVPVLCHSPLTLLNFTIISSDPSHEHY